MVSGQAKQNILKDWHVVYHGTKSVFVGELCESGLILLRPNDYKLTGSKTERNKIRRGHIQSKFIRTNKHTKQKEVFDPNQIFTSPSPTYSSYYCDKSQINGHTVSFIFQCRQKPGTYQRGQETMAFRDEVIDPYINNDCIEFYTRENLNIIITGILIKVHDYNREHVTDSDNDDLDSEDEKSEDSVICHKCKGSGRYEVGDCYGCKGTGTRFCRKCKGTGIFKKALSCNACHGTGTFRNGQRCRKCRGSGEYKPALKCKFCSGSAACGKCDGTGRYTVTCRMCEGSGEL